MGYILVCDAHDKNKKQSQTLSDHAYDKNGEIIESASRAFQVSAYEAVVPGTIGEDMYDFVLSYYNKNKK